MQLADRFGSSSLTESTLDALCSGLELSASLVATQDGQFSGIDGTSNSVSNPVDRAWLAALRRNSEVVLTSGETFRAENYRMPKVADLAVLSRVGVSSDHLQPKAGQRLHLLGELYSYVEAVVELKRRGYRRIHVEFGPTGMRDLIASKIGISVMLSGPSRTAIVKASESLAARFDYLCEVDGLHLGIAR